MAARKEGGGRRRGPARVAIVLGTKAELIKMSPVMHELARRRIAYSFVYTGQHNIEAELREHGIPAPDFVFDASAKGRGRFSSRLSASAWSFSAFLWLRERLSAIKPRIVLVHGDTMTTAAGALAVRTIFPRPLLAHVEAGLRSGSLSEPFPEEISRRVADSLSDWFFASTYYAAGNLLAEGKPRDRIVVTGNTNIDVLSLGRPGKAGRRKLRNYIIAKLHRHENIHSRKRLERFLRVLERSPFRAKLLMTENLARMLKRFSLEPPRKVQVLGFLPQRRFFSLLGGARAIITDAGGETEEAAYLSVPCIQFRERSERQESELSGASIRTTDDRKILSALESLRNKKAGHFGGKAAPAANVFGEGRAAREIVSFLQKNIL